MNVPAGVDVRRMEVVQSQKALDTLLAHAQHGFQYGHFSGEFHMDGGTYEFQTLTRKLCIEENYHRGDTYMDVPSVTFSFHPCAQTTEITINPPQYARDYA